MLAAGCAGAPRPASLGTGVCWRSSAGDSRRTPTRIAAASSTPDAPPFRGVPLFRVCLRSDLPQRSRRSHEPPQPRPPPGAGGSAAPV